MSSNGWSTKEIPSWSIEHNIDVLKVADHLIDVGPNGGQAGGEIVATGTPEEGFDLQRERNCLIFTNGA